MARASAPPRTLVHISKRRPENSPELSKFLYVYGNGISPSVLRGAHLALVHLRGVDVEGGEHVLEQHARELEVLVAAKAVEHHQRRRLERGRGAPRARERGLHVARQGVLLDLQRRRRPLHPR